VDGLQQAEAALKEEKEAGVPEPPDEQLPDDPTDLASIARAWTRTVLNPNVHGDILHLLHRATIDWSRMAAPSFRSSRPTSTGHQGTVLLFAAAEHHGPRAE
jgi:hypothetical protein